MSPNSTQHDKRRKSTKRLRTIIFHFSTKLIIHVKIRLSPSVIANNFSSSGSYLNYGRKTCKVIYIKKTYTYCREQNIDCAVPKGSKRHFLSFSLFYGL